MRTTTRTHHPFDSFETARTAAYAAREDARFAAAAASNDASDFSDIDIKNVRDAAHLRIGMAAPDSSDARDRLSARGIRGLRRAVDHLRINVREFGNVGSTGYDLYQSRISA